MTPDDDNGRDTLGVAVIGMACRFPGANHVERFWENLKRGVESISHFTDAELEAEGIDPGTLKNPSLVKAHAIIDNIEMFDGDFFGFSPRVADTLNPQHRIFLECASEALEAAGYGSEIGRRRVGVYAGIGNNTYLTEHLLPELGASASMALYELLLGNEKDFLSTMVSYKLDLKGPSLTLQTACSTSLVAIHVAAQSLLTGECDMALAGGVNIQIPQKSGYFYQENGIFSPDGHCRAFDSNARGCVGGNGAGIVLLKRLDEALADGDEIHAIIRGSAINNDGSLKAGFTAPSVEGQAKVIAEAIAVAGIKPQMITYVETHGTGTPLGDPIEIAGLTSAFRADASDKKRTCAIGSVKTNIGHLDAAAGVAGFIKTVLAVKHGQLPPSLNYQSPNPEIDFENSPFYVNAELREWKPETGHRIAGVSSFGLGGTNAHMIIEEPPPAPPTSPVREWNLFLLSARTETALQRMKENLAEHLNSHEDVNLSDAAYTLQVGRRFYEHRHMFVASDLNDVLDGLQHDASSFVDMAESDDCSVVFLFPGGGAQYPNMGLGLYQFEPEFRAQIDLCLEILSGLDCDLRDTLFPLPGEEEAAAARLKRTSYALPALFAVEYALAKLWISWGVRPRAMIGHSMGEYVAACLAGVFSLEDALSLILTRGRLLEGLPAGAMLSVNLCEEQVQRYLNDEVAVGAINSPENCMVGGAAKAISELAERLGQDDVTFRYVHIDVASHSPSVEPILKPFGEFVSTLQLNPCRVPFISNVTGTWITNDQATSPAYWCRHLRETVRFSDGLRELCKGGTRILLETGPGQTLSALARLQADALGTRAILSSIRHPYDKTPDRAFLLNSLGALWQNGADVDWQAVSAGERRRRVPLPTYPFDRRRHWVARGDDVAQPSAPKSGLLRKADIGDWFYAPSWKRLPKPALAGVDSSVRDDRRWIVFLDQAGIGMAIASLLEQSGHAVTRVAPWSGEAAEPSCFVVDPQRQEDYVALVKEVASGGVFNITVVHLWGCDRPGDRSDPGAMFEPAQYAGFYSLLFLAQALAKENIWQPVQIAAVTSGVQDVLQSDELCPEKATMLSACKVIPQEYGNISCRSIDIPYPAAGDDRGLIESLLSDLTDELNQHTTLAYRAGHRWAQIFEPISLPERSLSTKLRRHGVYLITGGLGGVGLDIANYLAKTMQAKLVLISRSSLNSDSQNGNNGSEASRSRISRVQAIEAAGGEVMTIAADVADEAQMRDAIAQCEARFGPLNGVIHSALGKGAGREIRETTPSNCEDVFRAKVFGTLVLERVLRGRELDFFVLCSSLASLLGGVGHGAYSAANLFMDSYAAYRNRKGEGHWTSANLEVWIPGTGNGDDTALSFGPGSELNDLAVNSIEGCEVFRRLVSEDRFNQVAISTGDLQRRVNEWVQLAPVRQEKPTAARSSRDLHPRPRMRTEYVAPQSELDQTIADIWQQVLGVDRVGIDDNFFELGGHSLQAMILISRLRAHFQVDIELQRFFNCPTISDQSLAITQHLVEQEDQGRIARLLEELTQDMTSA